MKTILTTQFIICMLLLPGFVQAQIIAISGNVTNCSGTALENVSIFEANRKIGTITNQKGFFKLILSAGEINLKISDSGFKEFSKEFTLSRDTTFTVQLESEIEFKNRNKTQTLHAEVQTVKKSIEKRFK